MKTVEPKAKLKLEAVSPRLRREFQHPTKDGVLYGLRFSPDGKRLIAGDYPGGIVQIWEVECGKQVRKLETGSNDTTEYFFLTPDWTILFAPQAKRKHSWYEQDGKKRIRWEFDGGVKSWDLSTGELRHYYRDDPPTMIRSMWLSPDGKQFATSDWRAADVEGGIENSVSIWDVASKRKRRIPEGIHFFLDWFSPNGCLLFGSRTDKQGYTLALEVVDTDTTGVVLSIPIRDRLSSGVPIRFSPDGRFLLGAVESNPRKRDSPEWQSRLKLWDLKTGEEYFSLAAAEPKGAFARPTFSPDGKLIAAGSWRESQSKCYLIDVSQRAISKSIILGDKAHVYPSAFSLDGRWLAIMTQEIPENSGDISADAVPQARIHLIDVAAGQIRETLIAPPGFVTCACFSPDGKTLATSGRGKVLLWDLAGLK